jgi:hypothetical protein
MTALAPTRATALASALAAYRGWFLLIHCAGCGRLRLLPVSELADRVGGDTLLRDILPWLRCQRCGDPPRAVKLSDGDGPAAREVWLLGAPRG